MAKKKRKKRINKEMHSQVKGILLLALGVFCFVGLVQTAQTGGVGLFVSNVLRSLAGTAALIIPFFIGFIGLRLILPGERYNLATRLSGLLILSLLAMIWLHLQYMIENETLLAAQNFYFESFLDGLAGEGGGALGAAFAVALFYLLGATGSRILLFALALIAVLFIFNISIKRLIKSVLVIFKRFKNYLKLAGSALYRILRRALFRLRVKLRDVSENKKRRAELESAIEAGGARALGDADQGAETVAQKKEADAQAAVIDYQSESKLTLTVPDEKNLQIKELPVMAAGKKGLFSRYILPPLELLITPSITNEQQHLKSSKERARLLENTLQDFGVKARVVHVQSGPTVTRFEVQPEAGVKVSRIISLSDDIALNLAAPLVRIEAPIPGKAALGIEVPNNVISLVYIREVFEENAYKNSTSPLTVALGKDITGVPVIADLTKMPHLLIAGATGAGKSVCLNTLINSILFKSGPEQVRFMMIDPKVVELTVYNGIPHLIMPVLTDPRKASLALRNMVREMGRRYDLFARLGVRDIATYNELATEDEELENLPFIVVVIDELADLMHVSPGEVEDAIARLAQMSRASGIHLIVATQRPSVDVLTGIIKANITSRIAFTVSSQFDSRTILDMAGAEKLLGRGDMLFYPVGAVKPFRVQGAYVSEAEIKRITDFIKEQGLFNSGDGNAFLETPEEIEEEEADTLFAEAVDLVVRTGQASISLLQRRFRIGYTRAARLIDDLERRGIVGQFEGSKPREVLVTPEQATQICEDFRQQNE